MAKKEVNKSQLIRDILTENPKAKFKTIKADLDAKGIKVAGALFYYVKGSMKKAKRLEKKAVKAAAPAPEAGSYPIEVLVQVKALSVKVGGMKNLMKLVTLLAE